METPDAFEDARIQRFMEHFKCSYEDAERYAMLRDEGYSRYQAKLMAGLCDPEED